MQGDCFSVPALAARGSRAEGVDRDGAHGLGKKKLN
jgi:hypothetical protein